MDFTLYNVTAPNNALDKLSTGTIIDGFSGPATIDISVLNPTLIVETDSLNFIDANYMYIIDYGKGYFIEDKIVTTARNIVTFKLREDVLQSFSDGILNLEAVVERQTNNYDMYLPDPHIPVDCRKTVTYREFRSNEGFGLTQLYMVVLGGDN